MLLMVVHSPLEKGVRGIDEMIMKIFCAFCYPSFANPPKSPFAKGDFSISTYLTVKIYGFT